MAHLTMICLHLVAVVVFLPALFVTIPLHIMIARG